MAFSIEGLLEQVRRAKTTFSERNTFGKDDDYGIRRFFPETSIRKSHLNHKSKLAFAEDDCGNFFTVSKVDETVWFWDHETNENTLLANTVEEFFDGLHASRPIELNPGQVMETWINPEFARSLESRKSK